MTLINSDNQYTWQSHSDRKFLGADAIACCNASTFPPTRACVIAFPPMFNPLEMLFAALFQICAEEQFSIAYPNSRLIAWMKVVY